MQKTYLFQWELKTDRSNFGWSAFRNRLLSHSSRIIGAHTEGLTLLTPRSASCHTFSLSHLHSWDSFPINSSPYPAAKGKSLIYFPEYLRSIFWPIRFPFQSAFHWCERIEAEEWIFSTPKEMGNGKHSSPIPCFQKHKPDLSYPNSTFFSIIFSFKLPWLSCHPSLPFYKSFQKRCCLSL